MAFRRQLVRALALRKGQLRVHMRAASDLPGHLGMGEEASQYLRDA
jgi:hypothetical protein